MASLAEIRAKLQASSNQNNNNSGGGDNAKAWKEIWSAGQGIGAIKRIEPAGDYIDWLVEDYRKARLAIGLAG